ncbi:MAG TPA: RNase H family protein, partial [Candidatus Obscuribacterales bacterium]
KGINEWLPGWVKKGWINSQKKPVANVDLWKEMLTELEPHIVTVHWVKGHSGHPENEFCDQAAREEALVFTTPNKAPRL